jgi:hypothetical protein
VPFDDTTVHHGSHKKLLLDVESPPTEPGVDAVVVPTVRPPTTLRQAADLALELGSTLVTLHSGADTSADAAAEMVSNRIDLLAIDLALRAQLDAGRKLASSPLLPPSLETTRLTSVAPFARASDLSFKRNLALAMGRMLGWSRVLFLDDDITGVSPEDVRRGSGLLGPFKAVGLRLEGPVFDHSVVCEAYRRSGGSQESFVGGGALIVECDVALCHSAFFPDIYNDDWFFLLDGEKGLLPTAATGRVVQLPYDPFSSLQRAVDQELGDVLAEGTYWLLDQGRSIRDADIRHWRSFLKRRRLFISQVLKMIDASTLSQVEKARRTAALVASRDQLGKITPRFCARYLRAWMTDREIWHDHLERLPTDVRPEALAELAGSGRVRPTWRAAAPGAGQHA